MNRKSDTRFNVSLAGAIFYTLGGGVCVKAGGNLEAWGDIFIMIGLAFFGVAITMVIKG